MTSKHCCKVEKPRLTETLLFCSWTTQDTSAQRILGQRKRESEGPRMTFMARPQTWHEFHPHPIGHIQSYSPNQQLRKCGLPGVQERKVCDHSELSPLKCHSDKYRFCNCINLVLDPLTFTNNELSQSFSFLTKK